MGSVQSSVDSSRASSSQMIDQIDKKINKLLEDYKVSDSVHRGFVPSLHMS